MFEILKAIFLGFIQGVTEFLPISSSGHLAIAQHFLNYNEDSGLLFTVLLHMGTLLAVLAVYYKTILALIFEAFFTVKDIVTGKFKWNEMKPTRRMLFMFVISCLPLLLLLLPIGGGRSLLDFASDLSQGTNIIFVVGFCLLVTAALLLVGARRAEHMKHPKKQIDGKSALTVGFAQLVAAALPGISRSGSTISTGLLCGVSREYMVRYSFILGIPAILAANVVELKEALAVKETIDLLPLVFGVVTAAVVGFLAIKVLEWLVKKDKFKFFGYYCLGIGSLVLIIAAVERFIK